jgi:hypothetical protein
MPTITLTAVVDENGHLAFDVPLPPGPVEVVVRPVAENGEGEAPSEPQTREWIEARLREGGLLAEEEFPDAFELSLEEEIRLGTLLKGPRPVEDYINEDREERF